MQLSAYDEVSNTISNVVDLFCSYIQHDKQIILFGKIIVCFIILVSWQHFPSQAEV